MIRRPPRSKRTDTLFPYTRSSDLSSPLLPGAVAGGGGRTQTGIAVWARPLFGGQPVSNASQSALGCAPSEYGRSPRHGRRLPYDRNGRHRETACHRSRWRPQLGRATCGGRGCHNGEKSVVAVDLKKKKQEKRKMKL